MYYVYQAEIYCEKCGDELCRRITGEDTGDSNDFPQVECGSGEADKPQFCSKCNTFMRNPLTDEGYQWVIRTVKTMIPILTFNGWNGFYQWLDFYFWDVYDGRTIRDHILEKGVEQGETR